MKPKAHKANEWHVDGGQSAGVMVTQDSKLLTAVPMHQQYLGTTVQGPKQVFMHDVVQC